LIYESYIITVWFTDVIAPSTGIWIILNYWKVGLEQIKLWVQEGMLYNSWRVLWIS